MAEHKLVDGVKVELTSQEIAQRQAEAIALAIAEEEKRQEQDRITKKRAADKRAAEIEAERVRQAEIAEENRLYLLKLDIIAKAQAAEDARILQAEIEAEAERVKIAAEKKAAQAEADRVAAVKKAEKEKAEKAEADRIAAEKEAAQAEADKQAAIKAKIEADKIKDDELRRFKVAQEEEDEIKEQNRILKLIKDANAAKLEATNNAKKAYEESISLLKAQNELTIAMQKSFIDTIINF